MTEYNPLDSARLEIKKACDLLETDPAVYEILQEPLRLIAVNIPVKMDDGSTKTFKGYRSMHNDAIGPGKGGVRFHPGVNADEVKALSIWMTFKCCITGIPYGGGKGGICVNPDDLSEGELERLARGYVRAMHRYLGEKIDIPAPDVGTNGKIISWMTDEYNIISGHHAPGTFTGKPVEWGGSLGRNEATGLGVAIIAAIAAEKQELEIRGSDVSVQGFGNVGSFSVKYLDEQGAHVKRILEVDENGLYGIYREEGFRYPELEAEMADKGTLRNIDNSEEITEEDFWKAECDILVPAALENAINESNADDIKAKLIVEAANGPITPEADKIFDDKDIIVIPDVVANSGGVTVSYFEWVQNLYGYYWTEEEVATRQEDMMKEAFERIWQVKEEYNVNMRSASYIYSVGKLAEVMKLRAWY